jgi:hypothetical protein
LEEDMSSAFRIIFYLSVLLLFPLSSQADVKIYFGLPGYSHYNNNYYTHSKHHKKYYKPYSNYRHNRVTNIYGNKHDYDRANYYRNKYSNSQRSNSRRYNNAYTQGFNDGQQFKRHNRKR